MSIHIKDLTFSYDKDIVLNNIQLNMNPLSMTAIMGLSGCGKTTLLRLLLGLNYADSGTITIDNHIYGLETIDVIRKKVSYVPQHGALYPHLTIEENILLPLKVRKQITSEHYTYLKELIHICSLEHSLLDKKPSQLSGGQKQRASIIRALLMDTPYILMDEPFSALDPITKVTMQKEFKNIFKENNKTIVMVTHALQEAKYLCDQICIMNEGTIEQVGSYQELMDSPSTSFVEKFIHSQL